MWNLHKIWIVFPWLLIEARTALASCFVRGAGACKSIKDGAPSSVIVINLIRVARLLQRSRSLPVLVCVFVRGAGCRHLVWACLKGLVSTLALTHRVASGGGWSCVLGWCSKHQDALAPKANRQTHTANEDVLEQRSYQVMKRTLHKGHPDAQLKHSATELCALWKHQSPTTFSLHNYR